MTPPQDPKNTSQFISTTNAHSLEAAIFATMAFKLSLEVNNNKITDSTNRFLLKVLYIACIIKKKLINFEQYACIHLHGPKIAICETVSDTVFVLNS